MHFLNFTYSGHQYSLSLGQQTLTNQATGEVSAISQLRNYYLIAAVKRCMDNAEREKVYELILGRMTDNLRGKHEYDV